MAAVTFSSLFSNEKKKAEKAMAELSGLRGAMNGDEEKSLDRALGHFARALNTEPFETVSQLAIGRGGHYWAPLPAGAAETASHPPSPAAVSGSKPMLAELSSYR